MEKEEGNRVKKVVTLLVTNWLLVQLNWPWQLVGSWKAIERNMTERLNTVELHSPPLPQPQPKPLSHKPQLSFSETESSSSDEEPRDLLNALPLTADHTQHHDNTQHEHVYKYSYELPNDFLRIPERQAIQLRQADGSFEWMRLSNLQAQVLHAHSHSHSAHSHPSAHSHSAAHFSSWDGHISQMRSCVLHRHIKCGLGMTLFEFNGWILVQMLTCTNGRRISITDDESQQEGGAEEKIVQDTKKEKKDIMVGPAMASGIGLLDRIMGVNGIPFTTVTATGAGNSESPPHSTATATTSSSSQLLQRVVGLIQSLEDPIVVHFCSPSPTQLLQIKQEIISTLISTSTSLSTSTSPHNETLMEQNKKKLHFSKPTFFSKPNLSALRYNNNNTGNNNNNNKRLFGSSSPPKESSSYLQTIGKTLFLPEQLLISTKLSTKRLVSTVANVSSSSTTTATSTSTTSATSSTLHPLATCLLQRGIIRPKEQKHISDEVIGYIQTTRQRQWDSNAYLSMVQFDFDTWTNSTSTSTRTPQDINGRHSRHRNTNTSSYSPFRQGLNVHIVNTFLDQELLAYTLWVYDIESQKEWYAPIRYERDFIDLRRATMRLGKKYVEQLDFPPSLFASSVGGSGSNTGGAVGGVGVAIGGAVGMGKPRREGMESKKDVEAKCRLLEGFLKGLCALLYKDGTQNYTSEMALYIETFLGCDAYLEEMELETPTTAKPALSGNDCLITPEERNHIGTVTVEAAARKQLKEALQLYTYRLFFLSELSSLTRRFLTEAKQLDRPTSTQSDTESTKTKILSDLSTIRRVFSQLEDIIVSGCMRDLKAIASSHVFESMFQNMTEENSKACQEELILEVVREQVQIEVYVPLRSVISNQLVSGWRYDDDEMQFKIKVCYHVINQRHPFNFLASDESNYNDRRYKRDHSHSLK